MNSAKALFLIKTIITLHNNFISRCRLLRGNKSWGSWVQQYTMSLRDTDEIIKTDSCNISPYVCVGVLKVIACLGTTNPVFCSFTSQVRPHRFFFAGKETKPQRKAKSLQTRQPIRTRVNKLWVWKGPRLITMTLSRFELRKSVNHRWFPISFTLYTMLMSWWNWYETLV